MLDARLAGLEDRLLPEKRLRPPLAADKAKEAAARGSKPTAATKTKAKAKPKSMAAAEAAASRTAAKAQKPPGNPQPTAQAAGESWATVAKRGTAKGASGAKGPGQGRKPKAKPKKPPKKAKIRPPPTTSAVVLTLPPEAKARGADYGDVLLVARHKVDIHKLGVAPLSMKTTITGARMLMIQNDPDGTKAKAFENEMRKALNGSDVRITRPTKTAEIRVAGLDDCTTAAEVIAAVAKVGDCAAEDLSAGEIRRIRSGTGTIWVRCPVAAAQKVVANGRLLVGWASAAVKLMAPRQMRCFRCFEPGHPSATCTSATDRSGRCFRCGEVGHKATQCAASAPHCMLCAAAEKPAAHKMWSRICAATTSSKRKAAAAKPRSTPKAPPKRPQKAGAMEE